LTFCHINKYNVTESARVRDHVNVDPWTLSNADTGVQ